MITSKTCELAIQALILIAQDKRGEPIPISELHRELKIGLSYMTKVLQPLTQSGILLSYKGAKGGVLLNKKPEEINLKQIIAIMDGDGIFTDCAFSFTKRGFPGNWSFGKKWEPVRKLIAHTCETTSIADLSDLGSGRLLKKVAD